MLAALSAVVTEQLREKSRERGHIFGSRDVLMRWG